MNSTSEYIELLWSPALIAGKGPNTQADRDAVSALQWSPALIAGKGGSTHYPASFYSAKLQWSPALIAGKGGLKRSGASGLALSFNGARR